MDMDLRFYKTQICHSEKPASRIYHFISPNQVGLSANKGYPYKMAPARF